eukprot:Pgem_evm1s1956
MLGVRACMILFVCILSSWYSWSVESCSMSSMMVGIALFCDFVRLPTCFAYA